MAHGQLDGDLAAEGVAQHRHRWQYASFQPRGQVIGMLGDAQDPPRVATESEAGQLGRQRHQVAVGDRQPMDQDQRERAAGAGERAPGMSHDASDRPPTALEAQAVRGARGASRYRSRAAARAPGTPGIAGCWPSSTSWPGDRTRSLGEPKPPGR